MNASSPQDSLAFLQRPDSYPERPARVELVETHLAWVFLAGEFVYKLKKPVVTPYLDYSTVALRRRFCEEEVRLNRRLAPDVYLGAVPLTRRSGTLRLGGTGDAVDWLVHMRRLPAERTLERLIDTHTVPENAARRIAERLAAFYDSLPPAVPERGSAGAQMRRLIDENQRELSAMPPVWDGAALTASFQFQRAFLDANADLLTRRERAGCIVEGHGDLRLQHIYLLDQPVIIDCLEFNRDLRIMDRVSELAFVALECERHGVAALGAEILNTCCGLLDDSPPEMLIRFYRAYHACMRAKLALWRLQNHPGRREKYVAKLRRYLRLAEAP